MRATGTILRFIYSLICYFAGVASLIYLILFANALFLPKTVNTLIETHSFASAFLMNILALSLFGLQHSIMARHSFKRWLTRFIHPDMERSTYVLSTAIVIVAMCYLWVPVGEVLWQVESEPVIFAIRTISMLGWALMLWASFMINHFELFGLSQTFNPMLGRAQPVVRFSAPGIYKLIRHPIQTGILIGIWAVPVSTTSHLMFAGGLSVYILVGLYFEEKDLIRDFGSDYLAYKKRVKRLIPFIH